MSWYPLTWDRRKCNRDNIPHRLVSISKHSDTVSMRGGQLIQEKVKICSFKECCSLKFSVYGWKKKSILLENKMNDDRHKMISLVLNKEAKCTIFVFNTVCRVWRPRPYTSTQISLECLPPPSQPFPPFQRYHKYTKIFLPWGSVLLKKMGNFRSTRFQSNVQFHQELSFSNCFLHSWIPR